MPPLAKDTIDLPQAPGLSFSLDLGKEPEPEFHIVEEAQETPSEDSND